MIIYNQMTKRKQELESKIQSIDSQIANLPPGKFFSIKNGKHYKWFQSINTKNSNEIKYIHKKNRPLASKLAYKRYLSCVSNELKNEHHRIEVYLKNYPKVKESDTLLENPDTRKLILENINPLSKELSDWQNEPYEKNPNHPEALIHKCISGNIVRSKSESIIDTFLYKNNIPYKYEAPLQFGKIILYPDFTIRHPKTGKIYYWEHFGKMDDEKYARKTFYKLQLYNSHGLIPSINLITTYETAENPLDINTVDDIIAKYFI